MCEQINKLSRRSSRACAFLVYACAATCMLSGAATAAERHVPADYPTIQAAIDAAEPGDTVIIADGTYTGPGNRDIYFFGKAITVRSANGEPSACVIDCEGAGRGFLLVAGETEASVIADLTITGGGAAITCSESSPSIRNCAITGNFVGLEVDLGSPTVTNCAISQSIRHGVRCQGGSLHLTNCIISDNLGTGIYTFLSYTVLTLVDCAVTGNGAGWPEMLGGGVCCLGGELSATNCTFANNIAGGVNCAQTQLDFTNCTISGNTSQLGAGLWLIASGGIFIDCTISGNLASDKGGGLYLAPSYSYAPPVFLNCTFSGNSAAQSGGGLFLDSSTAALEQCTIANNIASDGAGAYIRRVR